MFISEHAWNFLVEHEVKVCWTQIIFLFRYTIKKLLTHSQPNPWDDDWRWAEQLWCTHHSKSNAECRSSVVGIQSVWNVGKQTSADIWLWLGLFREM